MKKQLTVLSVCLLLFACDVTNTGLISNSGDIDNTTAPSANNPKEYLQWLTTQCNDCYSPVSVHTGDWPAHNGYNIYEMSLYGDLHGNKFKNFYVKSISNEKEMTLGNYGVHVDEYIHPDDNPYPNVANAYTYNKKVPGANAFVRGNADIIIKGGVLAYLTSEAFSDHDTGKKYPWSAPKFIKGEFFIDVTKEIIHLDFDNYYSITFKDFKTEQTYVDTYPTGYETYPVDHNTCTVKITGKNSTGSNDYNAKTGTFHNEYISIPVLSSIECLQKDEISECFGTIEWERRNAINKKPFSIKAAFGGIIQTKQTN